MHVLTLRSPRLARLGKLGLVAASAVLMSTLALAGTAQADSLPAPPASPPGAATPGAQQGIEPATAEVTGSSCTYGSSSGNVYTCVYAVHSGDYIDYVNGNGDVVDSTRTLDECIYYSGSDNYLACSGWVTTSPGNAVYVYWSPYANEPSGYYCTSTWRLNSDGSETDIGWTCVDVT